MTHQLCESHCRKCKGRFMARTADLKRGLGRFCSFSCRSKARWSLNNDSFKETGASDAERPSEEAVNANVTELRKYQTLVVDPPWQFHRQSNSVRPPYGLLDLETIKGFSISKMVAENSHLYLWVPNAMVGEGYEVMKAWGFEYKTMLVWVKHQMGVGNYYRNSTEPILFGVKGRLPPLRRNARTWFFADRREHSRKPDEFYRIVETMSPGPRIDVFSRERRPGWDQFGNQCDFFNSAKGDQNDRDEINETGRSGAVSGGVEVDGLRMDKCAADPLQKSRPSTAV